MSTELLAPIVLDCALAVTDTAAKAESIAEGIGMLALVKRRVRELDEAMTNDIIAWLKHNKTELVVGDVRHYVGPDKSWRCTDPKGVYEAIMQATGGDVDVMLGCLSSGAWKQGAARKVLGDTRFFVEEVKDDLKTGKPKDKLHKIDPKWMD